MEKSKTNLKRKVTPNDTAESPAFIPIKQSAYRLEREKASLVAKLKLLKKEMTVLRASRRDSEFKTLQNPDRYLRLAMSEIESFKIDILLFQARRSFS